MVQSFGHLEQIDLRTIWPHEASDFTPWLAENLHFLGRAIKIDLELEDQEKNVGPFRADILAKDIQTNAWVLIENQLEPTDHGHLGQLITYAAGLEAMTLIWIAEHFTDEHVAALDWLNSVSDDSVSFFGIQIEVWSIGDNVAPRFQVVSKPNTWTKKGKKYKRLVSSVQNKNVGSDEVVIDEAVTEIMNRYPIIKQWVDQDRRSATIEEVIKATGLSPQRVRRAEKTDKAFHGTRREGYYRVDSVIAWLKGVPLPKSKERETPGEIPVVNVPTNGHKTDKLSMDDLAPIEV